MTREFAIVPPDARLLWVVVGVLAAAALAGLAQVATIRQEPLVWLFLPVILAALALFAKVLQRRRVMLDTGMLTIVAGALTRRIAIANIDLDAARIVDLREHIEWAPFIELFGTRLPGFSSGHFWLRNRSRAFVLLTTRDRVLVLPEKSGTRLLLSLQQPQSLLDALQASRR